MLVNRLKYTHKIALIRGFNALYNIYNKITRNNMNLINN